MKIKSALILIFVFSCTFLSAQINDTLFAPQADVQLTTKHYGDKIVLRWAPTDEEWWLYGMLQGYSVARKDMSDVRNHYEVLVDTIKPWSQAEIEEFFLANPDKEEVAVPLKTMYQDWENTNYKEANFADIFERSEFFKQRHQMTILAADLYPNVADAAGMRFVDNDIDPEKIYSYRVRFNKSDAKAAAYNVCRKWNVIDRPIIFQAKEKEGHVVITWERDIHESMYTSYFIERSIDSINFVRLNKLPYTQGVGEGLRKGKYLSYLDRVENYEMHYYRLVGIDAFGDLSYPSVAILAQGKDRTPPKVEKLEGYKNEDNTEHLIKWSHSSIGELSQAIIWKKTDIDQHGEIIYNETDTTKLQFEIVDENPVEGANIYQLILVDTAGNYGQSMPLDIYQKDKTMPRAPINLSADVDTSGKVILKWDQGPDLDILAYYVFTAPRKNDNYIKLNQKKHFFRIYEDTINMTLLTDKRYYKVAAMDKGGNVGAFSEPLEVILPDKIPPAPSLFFDYRVDTSGVYLGLIPSSSIDVEEHRLYRKKTKASDWSLIKSFGPEVPKIYLDDQVTSNEKYTYKWIAVDEGNLESDATHSTINVTAFDSRVYYRPRLRLTKNENTIDVAVSQDIPGDNYRIQIIKSVNGQKYKTVTTLKDTYTYTDKSQKNQSSETETIYRAKILYKDGKRSKLSQDTTIR